MSSNNEGKYKRPGQKNRRSWQQYREWRQQQDEGSQEESVTPKAVTKAPPPEAKAKAKIKEDKSPDLIIERTSLGLHPKKRWDSSDFEKFTFVCDESGNVVKYLTLLPNGKERWRNNIQDRDRGLNRGAFCTAPTSEEIRTHRFHGEEKWFEQKFKKTVNHQAFPRNAAHRVHLS